MAFLQIFKDFVLFRSTEKGKDVLMYAMACSCQEQLAEKKHAN